MLSSEIDLQTADGGVYDIHGNGLTAPRIRVSTGTSTLNLRAPGRSRQFDNDRF